MKYLHQVLLILLFSFLGELLHALIPWPIPASIYGMALMFLALSLRIIKVSVVKEAGSFFTSILPLLFVAPIVSLIDCWEVIEPNLLTIGLILVVTTVLCYAVSGLVTQALVKRKKGK